MEQDADAVIWASRPAPDGGQGRGRALDVRVSTLGARVIGLERARSQRRLVDIVRSGSQRRRRPLEVQA